MNYILDDLSLYTNKRFRSSEIIIEVWRLIESELLYSIGLSKNLIISIYIDNDSVILTCTSEYNVICSIRKNFNIDHILTTMSELSITTTINLNVSNKNNISYKKCSFYYEKDNKEDDGTVEIECDANYNITSYNKLKTEIISVISKELQFLIHRNVLNSNIDSCDISHIDSEFEFLNVHANLENKNIYKIVSKFLSLRKINKIDATKIYNLLDRIKNE